MFDMVALEEAARKAAGAHPALGSDDDLCVAAVGLARVVSLVSVGLVHVLAELDSRGVTDREYGLKTASWLAREANIPVGAARSQLKIGTKLRTLTEVDEAVIDGRLSVYHAKVLADACNPRVAEAIEAMQAELVGLAEGTTFERWAAEVHGVAMLLDEDGAHDPNEDLARSKLTIADTIDGITHLAGQLVGETALGVREAIETRADELFRRFTADGQLSPDLAVPPRATLRALALAELCRAGHAVNATSTRPPRPDVTLVIRAEPAEPDTAPDGMDGAARSAPAPTPQEPTADGPAPDGLTPDRPSPIAGRSTSGGRAPEGPTPPRSRPGGPTLGGSLPVFDRRGVRLADGTARTLCCDADVFALVVDSLGVPLDMGRNVRLATTPQRRAMAARDGTCVFPGCTMPPGWCDAHHLDPFHSGGRTNVARMACLCRYHHGVTHRRNWQMHATTDGWYWWQSPSGHRFWSQRHGRRRNGPAPPSRT